MVEIDARNLVVSRRAEDVADFPFGMVPAWDEGYLYVIGEGPGPVEVERPGNSVTPLDLKTFEPLKKIEVGKAPHAAAYTNGKVYVGNIAKGHRSVSVIDAATEGNQKKAIPPGVSVFKKAEDGSLRKLADMYADVPEGEDISGHHGSLN